MSRERLPLANEALLPTAQGGEAAGSLRSRAATTLINVARAPLVDEIEMLRALDDGRLAGAPLDVFNVEPLPPASPLWSRPHVLLSRDGY